MDNTSKKTFKLNQYFFELKYKFKIQNSNSKIKYQFLDQISFLKLNKKIQN